jgi:glycosyltransferase involved in cell wall biosynthesis
VTKLSVVIPVFNNSETLNLLYQRLCGAFSNYNLEYEIIFINDGSKDNSFQILTEIAEQNLNVKVLSLSKNYGQHPAICAGFEVVRGEYIVLMDADLQDNPDDIVLLLENIQAKDVDILYTIRTSNCNNQSTRITSKIYHFIFSKIVRAYVPNNIGTFRIFNKKFLKAILKFKEQDILYGPLMFYMGYKTDFIKLSYIESNEKKSGYSFSKRVSLAVNSLISYTDIPIKFFLSLGSGFLILSIIYLLIIVIQYYSEGANLPNGLTLIIILMSMGFGCMMVSIGIIGIYLFRVYQSVLNRPRYLIQQTINYMEEE